MFSFSVPAVEPRLVLSSPDTLPRIDASSTYSHGPTTTQSPGALTYKEVRPARTPGGWLCAPDQGRPADHAARYGARIRRGCWSAGVRT